MKRILGASFLLLFVCIGLLKAETENTVEMIETVYKANGNPAGCPDCASTNAGDQPADANVQAALMKTCVEAVCPSPSYSQAALEETIAKRASDPAFDKELSPLITEIAKVNAKDRIARSELLKSWLKDAKPLTSENGIRAFNFLRALERVGKFEYVADGDTIRIDIEKSRARYPQMSDDELKRAVLIETRMLKQFSQRAIIETDPSRLRLLYPGKRYRAVIDGTIRQIESLGRLIENNPDTSFLMKTESFRVLTRPETWKRYFENDTRNPEAVASVNNMISTLQLVIATSREPEFRAALQTKAIDIPKMAASEKFVEDLETQMTESKKFLDNAGGLDSPSCRRTFAEGQEVYPNEASLNAMRTGGIDKIRNEFMKSVHAKLSKQSATTIEKAARNWKPILPPSRENHLALLKKRLQETIEETKTQTQNFVANEKSKDRDTILAMAFAGGGKGQTRSLTSKADDLCDLMRPALKADGALSGGYVIGPLAFLKDSDGKGFAAHELGHLLFDEMMNATLSGETAGFFDQSRMCLIGNHTELTEAEKADHLRQYKRTGRSQYTEEDWVDGFAATTGSGNYGCFTVRQNESASYGLLSMKNAVATDDHGSWLQRTLHTHFLQKGFTPEICGEALRARGESANFQNCFANTQKTTEKAKVK